jgi:hypothetical protein
MDNPSYGYSFPSTIFISSGESPYIIPEGDIIPKGATHRPDDQSPHPLTRSAATASLSLTAFSQTMLLECKSIIQRINTARHILFAEEVLHRLSDFEVKTSAVNVKKARLYEAGFLLEKQKGDHQTEEAPAIQLVHRPCDAQQDFESINGEENSRKVTIVLVFNLKVNRGSSRHFQQSS